MKWVKKRLRDVGVAEARAAEAEAAAEYRAVKQLTPLYEKLAPHLADLSHDEFAQRVQDAFGKRPP